MTYYTQLDELNITSLIEKGLVSVRNIKSLTRSKLLFQKEGTNFKKKKREASENPGTAAGMGQPTGRDCAEQK